MIALAERLGLWPAMAEQAVADAEATGDVVYECNIPKPARAPGADDVFVNAIDIDRLAEQLASGFIGDAVESIDRAFPRAAFAQSVKCAGYIVRSRSMETAR